LYHRHSGIRYVTQAQRHAGQDRPLLEARYAVYRDAKRDLRRDVIRAKHIPQIARLVRSHCLPLTIQAATIPPCTSSLKPTLPPSEKSTNGSASYPQPSNCDAAYQASRTTPGPGSRREHLCRTAQYPLSSPTEAHLGFQLKREGAEAAAAVGPPLSQRPRSWRETSTRRFCA
jgi:hypothetical protein